MSAILEGTGAGTWAWNIQTGETKLDQRLADVTGRSLNEVHGFTREQWRALIYPEDFVRATATLKQHFIWVRSSGQVVWENGQIVRLVGAFQDILAQVLQRQALESANQRMRVTADSGSIGIWSHDLVTGAFSWDDSIFQLYGLELWHHELSVGLWLQLLHPSDRWIVKKASASASEQALEWSRSTSAGQRPRRS